MTTLIGAPFINLTQPLMWVIPVDVPADVAFETRVNMQALSQTLEAALPGRFNSAWKMVDISNGETTYTYAVGVRFNDPAPTVQEQTTATNIVAAHNPAALTPEQAA